MRRKDRLSVDYWRTRQASFDAYVENPAAREVCARDKAIGVLHDQCVTWADKRLTE